MIKILICFLLLLITPWVANADGLNTYIAGSTVVSSGSVSPDIEILMDTSNADCAEVGWSDELGDVNISCDSTTHRDGASGYALVSNAGNKGTAYINFSEAKTELWIEIFLHDDDADDTYNETSRYLELRNASFNFDIMIQIRDDSGYKWSFNAGSNIFGSAAVAPGQDIWVRVHLTRNDTTGVVEVWDSTDGSSFTQKIDLTGQDTTQGYDWERLYVGYNNNNDHINAWYYDTIRVWYSDPGW